MSYSSVIGPAESDQSDSRILIEACLARVRKEAGLDAEPVLPPLDVLLGRSQRPPARLVVGRSAHELPTAEAIVKSSVRPKAKATSRIDRADELPTTLARRMRWPVLLCGFIGGIFGGVALMMSPAGQKPAVQHVVKTVHGHLEGAYVVAVGATSSLVNR
jgi:hypothetical protein